MSLTSLIRPLFLPRAKSSLRAAVNCETSQRSLLAHMIAVASNTYWAAIHNFHSVRSYEEFAEKCPVTPYRRLRPEVMKMIAGRANILWPGTCRRFAQSSGTSDGASKYIPVTDASLSMCHFAGPRAVVAHYLLHHPESRMFDGKAFILGGSFASNIATPKGVKIGDLSAQLIDRVPSLVNLVRIPKKSVALLPDWNKKLPLLVESSLNCNVTNLSGVPSWFLTLLKEVLAAKGVSTLAEVWPDLEVFFHGGISFAPYRQQYEEITRGLNMNFVDTYNASEGFFAFQDSPESEAMFMLMDCGVFYEFQPLDTDLPPLPAWKVEKDKIYSLIITAVNGLWRYPLGDTVRIESVEPLKITITGRTKSFINAFGEELMVFNADAAIARTCSQTHASVANYTAAPVFASRNSKGRHEWIIEFNTMPDSIDHFAALLDLNLTLENSDYRAKRAGNIFLDPLSITVAPQGLFDKWLSLNGGKLGGQRKIPRLANDRHIIDSMLDILNQQTTQTTTIS